MDAAISLTEGRGGTFRPTGHPYRLAYAPSGDEPRLIVPFARSGRPMLAKPGPAIDGRHRPSSAGIAVRGRSEIDALEGEIELAGDVLLPILERVVSASLVAAGVPDRTGPGDWLAGAASGVRGSSTLSTYDELERSLAVGCGLVPPDLSWALGHGWRALYPAVVARLGGDALAEGDWPAFHHLAAELERVAFGPAPINAAKLLALVDAGQVDLARVAGGERQADIVVDAVLPGPGVVADSDSVPARLVADGHARIARFRRGLDVDADGSCRSADSSPVTGLAAIGRPTEDAVIGNDTLSRTLHPLADRWARRVVERCRTRRCRPPRRSNHAPERRSPARPAFRLPRHRPADRAPRAMAARALRSARTLLADWIAEHGSPLNVLNTGPLGRNASELQDAAAAYGIELAVYLARKANKALAFVDEAKRLGLGVDVASERELRQVLERGVPRDDVVVTAAVKPRALLELCVASGVTVAIDNADELALLVRLAAESERRTPIAFRLAPRLPGRTPSRFGLDHEQILALVEHHWPARDQGALVLAGVHFHLDGYAADERVAALGQSIELVDALRDLGHKPAFIDIGGGIPMSYLDDAEEWDRFWREHRAALLGEREPLTFEGHGLGLIAHAGEIVGRPNVYPYHQQPTSGAWLAQVLDGSAAAITERGLELRCEPGRALLDGCGLTAARVEFRKQRRDGTWLIGVAMNRTQCRSTSDDYLVDPLLVRPGAPLSGPSSHPIEGYLVGAYCIERELLTWRRLRFPTASRSATSWSSPTPPAT